MRAAFVLSGGMALGAYQAGAYERASSEADIAPTWLAGSSVGAVNGALIAGNPEARRVDALRSFWLGGQEVMVDAAAIRGPWRHLHNWMNVLHNRVLGVPGQFHPRLMNPALSRFRSLYDLGPMHRRLKSLVDFDILNAGPIRMTVVATDLETGAMVTFDTAKGDRITADHLLASCGFLPEFAPVCIDGRLLVDGGFVANAPVMPVLRNLSDENVVFIIDLFCRAGRKPESLEDAMARKSELLLSAQTLLQLRHYEDLVSAGAAKSVPVLHLSYRQKQDDAGPESSFDYSRATLMDRWGCGHADMAEAMRMLADPDFVPGVAIAVPGSQEA